MRTAACIPALNAEPTIGRMVIGCQRYVDFVLVCDDGSSDLTGAIAEKLGALVIKHDRNMGKGEALRSLFLEARKLGVDAMVTLDADGQHFPDDIPAVLQPLIENKAEIVIGSRFLKMANEIPAHRKTVNVMLNKLTNNSVSDTQSGFRGYGRRAIEEITPSEMGMGVDSEILMSASELGFSICEVPVSVKYGEGKTSIHNPIFHTMDVISSIVKATSIRHPLIFYGIPGFILVMLGLFYAIRTVAKFSATQVITTLVISYGLLSFALIMFGLLTLFVGVILFTLTTVVRNR